MNRFGMILSAGVCAVLLVLAFGLQTATAGQVTVSIEASAFSPEAVVIKAGDEIVWKNKDSATHTVTADDGSFDSGALPQGDEFKRKFPSAGIVTYSCDNHAWMKGKIEVRAE